MKEIKMIKGEINNYRILKQLKKNGSLKIESRKQTVDHEKKGEEGHGEKTQEK